MAYKHTLKTDRSNKVDFFQFPFRYCYDFSRYFFLLYSIDRRKHLLIFLPSEHADTFRHDGRSNLQPITEYDDTVVEKIVRENIFAPLRHVIGTTKTPFIRSRLEKRKIISKDAFH